MPWKYEYYTSVWEFGPPKGLPYRSALPYKLCDMLVKLYTKRGDLVVDPFCGSGQILKACRANGRHAIGLDVNPKAIKLCRDMLKQRTINEQYCHVEAVVGDARSIGIILKECDAMITHPPYWRAWRYGGRGDLSQLSYEEYLKGIEEFLKGARKIVKGHLVMVIGPCRYRGKFYAVHRDVALLAEKVGFEQIDEAIWVCKALTSFSAYKPYRRVREGRFGHFLIHHNYIIAFK